MYQEVVTALAEKWAIHHPETEAPETIGGRYALGNKDFTPGQCKGIVDEMYRVLGEEQITRRHFTVGIEDDVTGLSIPFDNSWSLEPAETTRCLFYGMGGDGTVGASKNSCKIIGQETDLWIQGCVCLILLGLSHPLFCCRWPRWQHAVPDVLL